MKDHDPLCPPGLKPRGPDDCPFCTMLQEARRQERQRIVALDHARAADNRP